MAGKSTKTLAERFWSKVDKSRGPNGCWPWTAAKNGGGYGVIRIDGKNILAHRASWGLSNGSIRNGLHCLHRCDNPGCLNPGHLFLGTDADNISDMDRKGRRVNSDVRGSAIAWAKLSDDVVREMRLAYAAGLTTQRELASRLGMSQASINSALLGKSWRHVT